MKPKAITLLSGGGVLDVGLKAAGFDVVAANEIDQDIADVYIKNHGGGGHMIVGDILKQNPRHYPDADLIHASTVCTNASIANVNGEESPLDIAVAEKVAQFIRIKKPRFFTLENVSGYRYFKSFRIIMDALDDLGYFYDVSILNSADFGVPQTRRRLFVRSVRNGFVPPLPYAVPWVGWYEALEDLIHTFPETQFAPWQLARLPLQLEGNFLLSSGGNTNFKDAKPCKGVRQQQQPAQTIMTNSSSARAFLVGQQKYNDQFQIAYDEQPCGTITANRNQKHLRAFVVSGGQAQNYKRRSDSGDSTKAVIRSGKEPIFTILANMPRQPARAWLDEGKVVRITPRGGARLQSIPDSYWLPDNETLAWKIIGNGVPSLMYEIIARSFIDFYGGKQ